MPPKEVAYLKRLNSICESPCLRPLGWSFQWLQGNKKSIDGEYKIDSHDVWYFTIWSQKNIY